jgi:nitroreductase
MTERTAETAIAPLFLDRWSPRAFDGGAVPQADLDTMFDAARWAPSAYNAQPWTFLYAVKGDANWDRFLAGLVPFNQGWAKEAGALVYFVSDTLMNGDDPEKAAPSHTHSFDTGAAWASFAFQAHILGYHTHGMSGVDFDAVAKELKVPSRYKVEAAAVVGRIGDPATLPEDLRAREVKSDRKPLATAAIAGDFPG